MSMSDLRSTSKGATMFPSFCPADAPPGEFDIFKMLAGDVGAAGWIVLHSLDIAEHVRAAQGEADFAVLIPGEGALVLEVKSHKRVKKDERGWWLGNATKPDKRGPFRQASEALHSIRNYLEDELTKGLPFVSAVVFTAVPFPIKSPEWHDWQVLDKERLHARPISASLVNIIRKARDFFASRNLAWMKDGVSASPEKLARVASMLRPRFEILSSPHERRKQLEDGLRRSTEQQLQVIDDAAGNPRLLVSGLAGTGKTTLAIEVVRREKLVNPKGVGAFFCYNHYLGHFLENECNPIGEGVRLGSFHSWMKKFSETKVIPDDKAADPNFWIRELPDLCIARLTAPDAAHSFLDFLVLDEAQDLFIESYLDIFDLLLKGGLKGGRWRFFGDFERQDIFASGAVPKTDFFKKRIDERCSLQNLSENCRNTPEISAALTIHARLKPGYSKVLRQDTRHDPEIRLYKNAAEQLASVRGLLDQYQAEGFKPSEIVLLSPRRSGCLAETLAAAPGWKGQVKEYVGNPKNLTFSTIHAFKGLEAPVVILTDIDSLDSQKDFDLLYIGMSRALHRLAVHFQERVTPELERSCTQ